MRRTACHASAARRPRAGFTLVELLVVITIIILLLGVTMPAINAAREQGRQVVCRGNLQNLGTAVVLYNNTNGFIPGWQMTPTSGTVPRSWTAMIMPFMERKDIGDLAMSSATIPGTYIGSLVCPTSPTDTQQASWLSYAGAAGGSGSQRAAGVMIPSPPRVSLDDVSASGGGDGQPTTLLLAEKCGVRLGGTVNTWNTVTNATGLRVVLGSPPAGRVINGSDVDSLPSSSHAGGAMVAFCDGHVQFLKESLSANVFAQLMSWDHGTANMGSPYNGWAAKVPIGDGDY